jgi:HSP20 family protein
MSTEKQIRTKSKLQIRSEVKVNMTAEDIRRFEEVMNRMFEDMFAVSRGGYFLPALPGNVLETKLKRQPFIDVVETDKEIVATAEMPGLKKEDIKINITDERLEISTESKHEEEKHGKDYLYKEIRSGSYYRSVALPSSVDPNNAKASYNNGVLEVKMPKIEIKKKTSLKIE